MDLEREWERWYHGQEGWTLRSERFWDDAKAGNINTMRDWLRAAWLEGVTRGARESREVLRDWGTAVSGCAPGPDHPRNLTEVFDRAADNLDDHWIRILGPDQKT